MYRQVPPPEHLSAGSSSSALPSLEEPLDYSKPNHVSSNHWKKFQELKTRREKECDKPAEKRKAALKNKALKAVSQELSLEDKALLAEEGVSLPSRHQRKRRREQCGLDGEGDTSATTTKTLETKKQWADVKQYLDPNPQLKGVEKGKYAAKSKLEETLDLAIEHGQFDAAVSMSEKLSQREFASKLATAFDCQDFVKKKKVEEEKRKARKQKLKWRFEHKQRWEMKGNM